MPLVGYALNLLQYDKSKYEDYFQQGCLQLIRCVDNFDPDCGKKFSTYAVKNIKWFLKEYIQRDFVIKPKVKDTKGNVDTILCGSLNVPVNRGDGKAIYLEDLIPYEDKYDFEKSNVEWCLDRLLEKRRISKRDYHIFIKKVIEDEKLITLAREYKITKEAVRLISVNVLEKVEALYKKMFPEEYEAVFNSYNKNEEE